MKAVDFRKPKKTWHITLTDDLGLDLKPPSKDLLDDIMRVNMSLSKMEEPELLETIYDVTATAISNNTSGTVVDPDELREILGPAELIDFLTLYMEFINEVISEKNSKSRTTLNRAQRRASNIKLVPTKNI